MGFLILELNFLVMGIMFLRKYFRSCQRRWANCNVTAHIISHRMYFVRLIILLLRGVEWSRFFPITSNGWVEVWFVLIYVLISQFFCSHIGNGIYCATRNSFGYIFNFMKCVCAFNLTYVQISIQNISRQRTIYFQ